MGCDIHLHVEVKVGDQWEHWAAPQVDRSYRLFAKMAGVRGDPDDAIVPRRGLPDDMSALTRLAYQAEEPDAHSASWLGAKEIDELDEWLLRTRNQYLECHVLHTYVLGNGLADVDEHRKDGITDVRLVFWFDN